MPRGADDKRGRVTEFELLEFINASCSEIYGLVPNRGIDDVLFWDVCDLGEADDYERCVVGSGATPMEALQKAVQALGFTVPATDESKPCE